MSELPRVLLLGDSIRLGYQPEVRRLLAGVATVDGPEENGGDTRNFLACLPRWLETGSLPRIIHANAGLHDIRRDRGNGCIAVPLEEYAANVRAILAMLHRVPGVQVTWATMTPVDEVRHAARKSFDRRAADVDAFNAAAVEACNEFDVPVHDLHAVIATAGRDLLWQDGIHLSDEGYRVAAETVAALLKVQAIRTF